MIEQFDVVIIGFGIAGASFAIRLAEDRPDLSILVIVKSSFTKTNTAYAQGGIAVVHDQFKNKNDSLESHKKDTFLAGVLANDLHVVNKVIERGAYLFSRLEDWGVLFDKDKNGKYDISLEGGHSYRRVLNNKDSNGLRIQSKLYEHASSFGNIEFREYHLAKELLLSKEKCVGVVVFDTKKEIFSHVFYKAVVLATGGIGQVYGSTTNAAISTGDGIVLAYKLGCTLEGMHLVQFHPTVLYQKGFDVTGQRTPMFLISEALRGEGAVLRNVYGEPFMEKYHSDKDLAPRDKVARANFSEMKKTKHPCVYLDLRDIDFHYFKKKFPRIYQKCQSLGIEVPKSYIPVVPAAHYLCGGIKVNRYAQTGISNLFAIGECASTGLHGANRLASNSLLEALSFADFAATRVKEVIDDIQNPQISSESELYLDDAQAPCAKDIQSAIRLTSELKQVCEKYLGVVKTNHSISLAGEKLLEIEKKFNELRLDKKNHAIIFELSNLISVSKSIQESCIQQKENIGVYYNSDLEKENKALYD